MTVSDNGAWLYAVNAGSNDVSAFAIEGDALTLTDRVASGGTQPVSITANGGLVYVLNAGTRTISGFSSVNGALTPVAGSTQTLLGSAPAQVQFAPSGNALVVTDKGTSTLETFIVGAGGGAGAPTSYPSAGSTPSASPSVCAMSSSSQRRRALRRASAPRPHISSRRTARSPR